MCHLPSGPVCNDNYQPKTDGLSLHRRSFIIKLVSERKQNIMGFPTIVMLQRGLAENVETGESFQTSPVSKLGGQFEVLYML